MIPIHGTPGDKKHGTPRRPVFFVYLFIILSQIGLYCLCR